MKEGYIIRDQTLPNYRLAKIIDWIDIFTRQTYRNFMWSKLDYIHLNPVRAGLVEKPSHYIYSSASNYMNDSALVKIEKADNPIINVLDSNSFVKYNQNSTSN